ncbi:unnamed protein product [Gordionus sp. m RMFG-2023]
MLIHLLWFLSHIQFIICQDDSTHVKTDDNNKMDDTIYYTAGCPDVNIHYSSAKEMQTNNTGIVKFPINYDVYGLNKPYKCRWNFYTNSLINSSYSDNFSDFSDDVRVRIVFLKFRTDQRCTTVRNIDQEGGTFSPDNLRDAFNISTCSMLPFYTKKYSLPSVNRILVSDMYSSSDLGEKEGRPSVLSNMGCVCGTKDGAAHGTHWYISSATRTGSSKISKGLSVELSVPRPQFGISFAVMYEFLVDMEECGGRVPLDGDDLSVAIGGFIKSPNYPSPIPAGLICVWTISLPNSTSFLERYGGSSIQDWRILLNFTNEKSALLNINDANYDDAKLLVINGVSGSSISPFPLMSAARNIKGTSLLLESETNILTIKLITLLETDDEDDIGDNKKTLTLPFKIRWSPFLKYEGDNKSGEMINQKTCGKWSFECSSFKNDTIPQRDLKTLANANVTSSFIHSPLYCVPYKLLCNDFIECPNNMVDEDERSCDTKLKIMSIHDDVGEKTQSGEVVAWPHMTIIRKEITSKEPKDETYYPLLNLGINGTTNNSSPYTSRGIPQKNNQEGKGRNVLAWGLGVPFFILAVILPILYFASRRFSGRKNQYDVKYYNTGYKLQKNDLAATKTEGLKGKPTIIRQYQNGITSNGTHSQNGSGAVFLNGQKKGSTHGDQLKVIHLTSGKADNSDTSRDEKYVLLYPPEVDELYEQSR